MTAATVVCPVLKKRFSTLFSPSQLMNLRGYVRSMKNPKSQDQKPEAAQTLENQGDLTPRDDQAETAEALANIPDPVISVPEEKKAVSEKKKSALPPKSKPADTRAARAFGRGFDTFLERFYGQGGSHVKDAAEGFTNEALEMVDDERTARYVRLGLTGFALTLALVPVALHVLAPDRLPVQRVIDGNADDV